MAPVGVPITTLLLVWRAGQLELADCFQELYAETLTYVPCNVTCDLNN